MPRPTLLQSLLQKPTQSYNSNQEFYSPATDVNVKRARRKAASEAGSDTDSIRSGRSFDDGASIRSSRSVGYNASKRAKSGNWGSSSSLSGDQPSRRYGNYLAERDNKSLLLRQPSSSSSIGSAKGRRISSGYAESLQEPRSRNSSETDLSSSIGSGYAVKQAHVPPVPPIPEVGCA